MEIASSDDDDDFVLVLDGFARDHEARIFFRVM